MSKENLVVVGNVVLVVGLGVLLGLGKIDWQQFAAGVGLLLAPSVVGVTAK